MALKIKKLSVKILFPVIISFILFSGIILYTLLTFEKKNIAYTINQETELFENLIDGNIERIGSQGLYLASVIASMDTIKGIYRAYSNSGDFELLSKSFKNPVDAIVKEVETNLNLSPRIHFHLPPAQSFYRCWTDKRGDDLSAFRHAVIEVTELGNPVSGIEIGRGGFVVRGIVPINVDGITKGSVEVYFSMKEVMRQSKLTQSNEVAIFMNKKYLSIATDFAEISSNIQKGKTQIGDLIIMDKTSDGFITEGLTAKDLSTALQVPVKVEWNNYFYMLTPLKSYDGESQGVSVVQVDIGETKGMFNTLNRVIVLISAGVLLLLVVFIIILLKKILANRLNIVKTALENLASGEKVDTLFSKSADETGRMVNSLNQLISRSEQTAAFAKQIGEKKYDSNYESLSDNDVIGNALVDLREKLQEADKQDKQRKKEDEQRNWAAIGLSRFSGIMRNHTQIESLTYEVIQQLVNYLGVNQGGFFLVNNNDKNDVHLELVAAYAYSRNKYISKRIEVGDGLVGRCMVEKDIIYLTDIPDDYINITSGTGSANPRCLLLVPLIHNSEIFGVFELASFNEIESYKVDFVKQVASTTAITILSVQSDIRTRELLEKSQQQAEEMSAQEEEMRQNLEELNATQEQFERRERILKEELEACRKKLNNS